LHYKSAHILLQEALNIEEFVAVMPGKTKTNRLCNNEIAEGIRNWDAGVLKFLYDNYYNHIDDFVLRNKGNTHDTKDLFHDVIIILNEKLNEKPLEIKNDFYYYFFSVCRYTWLNRLRNKKKEVLYDDRSFISIMESEGNIVPCLFASDHKEKEKLYTDHFDRMDSDGRKLLQLRFSNASYKRIVEELNLENEQQAYNKKCYCIKKLIESIKTDIRFNELIQ
jgi:DNA-directed RNA polymerase specialized sigma24 family protein